MYEAGGRIVHGKLSRQESEVSQCLRRCRIEQPVTSTAADYRLPAPQFLGRQPMLEINGLTGSHRSGQKNYFGTPKLLRHSQHSSQLPFIVGCDAASISNIFARGETATVTPKIFNDFATESKVV